MRSPHLAISALRMIGLIVLISACIIAGSLLLSPSPVAPNATSSPTYTYQQIVPARIQVGDSRNKAVKELSDAWRHVECVRSYPIGSFDDLFFYGAQDVDKATIIIVHSEKIEGEDRVKSIGLIENYLLEFYDCTAKRRTTPTP